MNTFIFTVSNVDDDCNFLNNCNLDYQYISPYGDMDSGFCDAYTGQQVLGIGDKFRITVTSNEELSRLLKCESTRLMHIHDTA